MNNQHSEPRDYCDSVRLAAMALSDAEPSPIPEADLQSHLRECPACHQATKELDSTKKRYDDVVRKRHEVDLTSCLAREKPSLQTKQTSTDHRIEKQTASTKQIAFVVALCLIAITFGIRHVLITYSTPEVAAPNELTTPHPQRESASGSRRPFSVPYDPPRQVTWAEFQERYAKYFEAEYQQQQKSLLRDRTDSAQWRTSVIRTQTKTLGAIFIDADGKVALATKYILASPFHEGLASVGTTISKEFTIKDFGYIDQTGELQIPGTFEAASRFSEGLAAVRKHGKYGFIDKTGKQVIECKYRFAEDFQNGFARCQLDVGHLPYDVEFIDKTGAVRFRVRGADVGRFSNGLLFANLTPGQAKVPVKTEYDNTVDQTVPDGRDVGYLNTNFDFEFKVATELPGERYFLGGKEFHDGMAEVAIGHKSGERKGYIDRQGKLVIENSFVQTQPFSEGLAAVCVTHENETLLPHRWGFIDKAGQMVIPAQFIWTTGFREGLAAVLIETESKPNQPPVGKWGFIDTTGNVVIEPAFFQAGNFFNGLARVQDNPFSHGYIDKTGTYAWQLDEPAYVPPKPE